MPVPATDLRQVLALPDGALLVLETGGLHRQLANGTLDPGFGVGGSLVPPTSPPSIRQERWHAMATLPDGRIIVVGRRDHTGPYQAALRVYSATGVLDTTHGDAGVLLWPSLDLGAPLPLEMTLNAVAVAADGSIIVAGGETATNPTRAFVSRVLLP